MSNWLITGGCGFIGTNLIARLRENGDHQLRVLDDLSVGTPEDLADVAPVEQIRLDDHPLFSRGAVQLAKGSILDEAEVAAAASGAEILVHLAASTGVAPSVEDPKSDCLANVLGTLNCLQAARNAGVRRFIFASSGAPVGECQPPIHEEKIPHPVSPYGASKLAGEGYCSAYFRTFGLDTVALRFGNVYGPRSKHKASVVAKFIRNALHGDTLEIYGDGTQTRDFIFVGDLVDAIILAGSTKNVGGEIFQIASSRECTIQELTEELLPILRSAGIPSVQVVKCASRPGDVQRNYSDTTKARQGLAWQAQTPLKAGLQLTVDWFVESIRAAQETRSRS